VDRFRDRDAPSLRGLQFLVRVVHRRHPSLVGLEPSGRYYINTLSISPSLGKCSRARPVAGGIAATREAPMKAHLYLIKVRALAAPDPPTPPPARPRSSGHPSTESRPAEGPAGA
jgi:hypothetical protein